jgi:hypothetical protein
MLDSSKGLLDVVKGTLMHASSNIIVLLMHPFDKAYSRPTVASLSQTMAARDAHKETQNNLNTRICTDYKNIYLECC